MARQQFTGAGRVWYVPTIANTSAPSAASEIGAGGSVDLTPYLRRDGLKTPQSGSTVDASSVQSLFNSQAPGTYGGDALELNLYRDSVSGTDAAYPALAQGTSGYIVIRRFGGSIAAAASGQKVEVWPVTVISRAMDDIAENENQKFTVECAVTSPPVDVATLAT